MLRILKRHEVEVLLKAGHSQAEVARLTGVGLRSVQRLLAFGGVIDVDRRDFFGRSGGSAGRT